jgi:hypothetical protein
MAIRGRTLYLALGGGDAERRGQTPPGAGVHNPQGSSSPLFGSILRIRFSMEVDQIFSSFQLSAAHQLALHDGYTVELGTRESPGGMIRVSVLARFPISEPDPNVIYRFSNLWGMDLAAGGRWLYVADASMNSVARVNTETGRWQRLIRFPPLQNTTTVGPPRIDAVPTSVRVLGDGELLVSFLTGFPFTPGNARVQKVDVESRTTEVLIPALNSVTDVLVRRMPRLRSQVLVLEFSQNQSADPPAAGRLLAFDGAAPQVIAGGLVTPVSMAYDDETGDLFILELRGQVLQLRLNQ